MVRKHINLDIKVNEKKGIAGDKDKKGFEKEIEAININRRISPTLLFQNLTTFGEIILSAGAGILAVGKLIKDSNLIDTDDPNPDTGDEQGEMEKGVSDFKDEVNKFDEGLDGSPVFGDTLNDQMSTWTNETQTAVTNNNIAIENSSKDMVTNVTNFTDKLTKGEVDLKQNVITTGDSSSYASALGSIAEVDLSSVTNNYVDSVTTGMSTARDSVDNILTPSYEKYNGEIMKAINNLNQVFTIKNTNIEDTPVIEATPNVVGEFGPININGIPDFTGSISIGSQESMREGQIRGSDITPNTYSPQNVFIRD